MARTDTALDFTDTVLSEPLQRGSHRPRLDLPPTAEMGPPISSIAPYPPPPSRPVEESTVIPDGSVGRICREQVHDDDDDDDEPECDECGCEVTACECQIRIVVQRTVSFTEEAVIYMDYRDDDGEPTDPDDVSLGDLDFDYADWISCDDYDYDNMEIQDREITS